MFRARQPSPQNNGDEEVTYSPRVGGFFRLENYLFSEMMSTMTVHTA